MVSTSTSGFIAAKLTENRKFIKIIVNVFNVIFWVDRRKTSSAARGQRCSGQPTTSSEARG